MCQSWYYWNSTLCTAESIWYYVANSWLTYQTACDWNDKYRNNTWQSSCLTVSSGYYSTPIWNVAHTWQIQCEANNYCVWWVKYSCPAWHSSPAWSSSAWACIKNTWST